MNKKAHTKLLFLIFTFITSTHLIALNASNDIMRNYGGNGNTGFCIWTNSICSNRKTNKDFERKKNSRRELQRGIMHCSKTFCYGGVEQNRELGKINT